MLKTSVKWQVKSIRELNLTEDVGEAFESGGLA